MNQSRPVEDGEREGKNIVDTPRTEGVLYCKDFADATKLCMAEFTLSPYRYDLSGWQGYVATMSIIEYYGDESFGHRQPGSQGCYVVAGYLGDSDSWKVISEDWRAVLDAAPSIGYFRMSECFSVMESKQEKYDPGQFAGFSPRQAREKLDSLVSVLERHGHALAGAYSITTWDIFEHALPRWDQEEFGSPYYLCVMGAFNCCREILKQIDDTVNIPVSFVFDEHGDSHRILKAWNIAKAFSAMPNTPEVSETLQLMGGLTFRDDKRCVPLQCADLLAWHVRREYIAPAEDHGRPRDEYERLRKSVNRYCQHLEDESTVRESRLRIWVEMYERYTSRHRRDV